MTDNNNSFIGKSPYNNEIPVNLDSIQPVILRKQTFIDKCTIRSVRISTGWKSVDIALNGGLADELYIMAAETSTGKSALMMSMAQNIAKQGINVLYFSLEMGPDEFIARAISALSFLANRANPEKRRITAGDILYWSYDKELDKFTKLPYSAYSEFANEYFSTYGKSLYIIESKINGFSANDISNISASFQKNHSTEKTVVFIDYLQILKADPNDRAQVDRKTKLDVSVTTLKALASQLGMPVFTASSVSRANYNESISTSSFKESGDTEYTGGILIGWNWLGVTDTADKDAIKAEKEACKERQYRKMNFEVLKFRNSCRDAKVKLLYYPAYNYFIDEYEWHPDTEQNNPFKSWNELESSDSKQKAGKNTPITIY